MGSYYLHSDYAPIVHEVACQGDPVALSIIHWAGSELGHTALAVIRQLGLQKKEFEVVLVGSLYDMGEMLITPMQEVITSEAPNACLVRLSAPPVVGGVLLAMEHGGRNPAIVRERLMNTTGALLRKQAV